MILCFHEQSDSAFVCLCGARSDACFFGNIQGLNVWRKAIKIFEVKQGKLFPEKTTDSSLKIE